MSPEWTKGLASAGRLNQKLYFMNNKSQKNYSENWECVECGSMQGRHDMWFEGDLCGHCNDIVKSEKESNQNTSKQEIVFTHNENDYVIEFEVEDQDFWVTIDGWDIHYCEDYNEICVYEYGNYRKSVYSRKIKN